MNQFGIAVKTMIFKGIIRKVKKIEKQRKKVLTGEKECVNLNIREIASERNRGDGGGDCRRDRIGNYKDRKDRRAREKCTL